MPKEQTKTESPEANQKPKFKSLLDWADEMPPFLCRAMAVKTGKGRRTRRIPVAELIANSGIKTRRFKYLCKRLSWEDVTVGDMSRFLMACNVDMMHRSTHYDFFRVHVKSKMPFLTRLQRQNFDKLSLEWKKMNEAKRNACRVNAQNEN